MSDSKFDDDDKTYSMPEPNYSPRSAKGSGLQLNFSMPSNGSGNGAESKNIDSGRDAPEGVQEDEILVVFDLPDGSQSENKFKFGQTVEFLKSYVESEFGIPMQSQILRFQGKVMMDPLSLLDFPDAKGLREMIVKVEGNLPAGAKK